MSKSRGSNDGLSEAFQELLANVARVVLGLGSVATLIGAGLLIFTYVRVAGDSALASEAAKNVGILKQVLTYGSIGVAVGAGFLFWGEDLVAGLLLLVSALLFFAPAWVPMVASGATTQTGAEALSALQLGGGVMGASAILVLVVDVANKTRTRAKVGVKADQLKYGKGVKEEQDKRNVFLGKCWQLPYCRKFVRERCPIYHARRSCWRERVGCMCEEEVIRKAMENKPIPKDVVLDGSNIPRNNRLTPKQKMERCKNCVIYNEHQRHKYKATIPVVLLTFLLVYALGHGPLTGLVEGFVRVVDRVVHNVTFSKGQAQIPQVFVEALLFFTMLLALTYTMKLVEYLVFKLKI